MLDGNCIADRFSQFINIPVSIPSRLFPIVTSWSAVMEENANTPIS